MVLPKFLKTRTLKKYISNVSILSFIFHVILLAMNILSESSYITNY